MSRVKPNMILNINLPERTIAIIGAVMAGLCGITLILSIWQWYHDWRLVSVDVTPAMALSSDRVTELITAIPNNHLFGPVLDKGHIPVTNLQLRVTGIVKAMNKKEASKAYISVADQPSKIYEIGDEVLDNVKIKAILPDAVMLENSGHLEKLPLPRQPLQFKQPPQEGEF